jgi:cytoplasmic iron level regulating protein YaaA (DUF328/UPF0246 family)
MPNQLLTRKSNLFELHIKPASAGFFIDNWRMIFLLSPAKSLDYETPVPAGLPSTKPIFMDSAGELIDILKKKSPAQIASLMDLSDKLSALNVARYQVWKPRATTKNAKQAVLAFNGDVYEGLNAASLSNAQLLWAQAHVVSLSGLYGVLRPLDLLQPYRLEMGTQLVNSRGKNLYQFWGSTIAEYLNQALRGDKTPVIVNLASQEYFKAADKKHLKARVVECVFEEYKNDRYKVISFMAKRARGLMARYAIEKRITKADKLQAFDVDGYAYSAEASGEDRWVFRRRVA